MEADKIGRGHTKSRQSGWTGPLGLMVEVYRVRGNPIYMCFEFECTLLTQQSNKITCRMPENNFPLKAN